MTISKIINVNTEELTTGQAIPSGRKNSTIFDPELVNFRTNKDLTCTWKNHVPAATITYLYQYLIIKNLYSG